MSGTVIRINTYLHVLTVRIIRAAAVLVVSSEFRNVYAQKWHSQKRQLRCSWQTEHHPHSETLEPAIASFQANGKDLYETIQDYSGQTEQLIFLKYESEACADKQLSKEEEMENLEAEIAALKDALEILESHAA